MSNKKILVLLILVLILSLLFFLGRKVIKKQDFCYGKTELSLSSSNGVFSIDEQYVYFLVRLNYYKPAVGICAFPDGGKTKSIYVGLDIYKMNLVTTKIERVYALSDKDLGSGTLYVGTSPNIFTTHKDAKYFYAQAFVDKNNNGDLSYVYFQVALDDGQVIIIPSAEEYENFTKNVPKIQDPNNNKDGSSFSLYSVNSIPQFELVNKNNKTSKIILSGSDWLPYNFE